LQNCQPRLLLLTAQESLKVLLRTDYC
jgi:hypothetical protein